MKYKNMNNVKLYEIITTDIFDAIEGYKVGQIIDGCITENRGVKVIQDCITLHYFSLDQVKELF